METNNSTVLVEGLKKLVEGAVTLIAFLEQQTTSPENGKTDIPAKTPAKEYTYEETRAILAEKSRTGFRAEVKAILTKYGVAQLSDVRDPKIFAAIVAEAEAINIG